MINQLDDTLTVRFDALVSVLGEIDEATISLNKDFSDFCDVDEVYFRLSFEQVQLIYKAMCDKRFEAKENEI